METGIVACDKSWYLETGSTACEKSETETGITVCVKKSRELHHLSGECSLETRLGYHHTYETTYSKDIRQLKPKYYSLTMNLCFL